MNITSNWLNLAVADLSVSEGFYQALGFTIKHNEAMQAKMLGIETADGKIIMLIEQQQFKKAASLDNIPKIDGALISLSVATEAEVDDLLTLVNQANGTVLQRGTKLEGYYGGLFSDPDGHRFNVIAMS
ncbi:MULTISPECIES: VOC family protein [Staphylococcus]|uniref:Glyoxalase n=1 Tax=Staphylococcus arlettae TaxID=29378 RepID=A0A380C072_9STAP|nr:MULTISPECIES: VOC family protein [Staphylococcus]KAB2477908.1 glyoxalase [Staphylococcus sp. CH99b_3]MCD8838871.1 glyoxalase [Staphylococcus arlettae]MCD8842147.1 glyoxalase [Staphylococcus arlettae]MCD8864030.1 glyoxalase [Staphylococcus arlettae]MCD8866059.1 glyoxalase [Staphylococcus arlettae]